ncbi:MAG: hypothetical protein KDI49_08365 [Gammaproteobacteria bacterium]|nr:hypothetical protein [Gammaproteobacteria bacterium]MCP5443361.1 hypothetical protein [Chromatiaceae bacterium]
MNVGDAVVDVKLSLMGLEELGRLLEEEKDEMAPVAMLMYNSVNAALRSLSIVSDFVDDQESKRIDRNRPKHL